jgi:hypothetical protein
MNVGIRTVAVQFLFWEYMFRIFGIVSLQCDMSKDLQKTDHVLHFNPAYHFRKILI